MISSGRYGYHLQDIAEIKAMPQPVNAIQERRLRDMEAEAAAFAQANPEEARQIQERVASQAAA